MYKNQSRYLVDSLLPVVKEPRIRKKKRKKKGPGGDKISRLKQKYGKDFILQLLLMLLNKQSTVGPSKKKKDKQPRGMRKAGKGRGGGGFQTAGDVKKQRDAAAKAARLAQAGQLRPGETEEDRKERVLRATLSEADPTTALIYELTGAFNLRQSNYQGDDITLAGQYAYMNQLVKAQNEIRRRQGDASENQGELLLRQQRLERESLNTIGQFQGQTFDKIYDPQTPKGRSRKDIVEGAKLGKSVVKGILEEVYEPYEMENALKTVQLLADEGELFSDIDSDVEPVRPEGYRGPAVPGDTGETIPVKKKPRDPRQPTINQGQGPRQQEQQQTDLRDFFSFDFSEEGGNTPPPPPPPYGTPQPPLIIPSGSGSDSYSDVSFSGSDTSKPVIEAFDTSERSSGSGSISSGYLDRPPPPPSTSWEPGNFSNLPRDPFERVRAADLPPFDREPPYDFYSGSSGSGGDLTPRRFLSRTPGQSIPITRPSESEGEYSSGVIDFSQRRQGTRELGLEDESFFVNPGSDYSRDTSGSDLSLPPSEVDVSSTDAELAKGSATSEGEPLFIPRTREDKIAERDALRIQRKTDKYVKEIEELNLNYLPVSLDLDRERRELIDRMISSINSGNNTAQVSRLNKQLEKLIKRLEKGKSNIDFGIDTSTAESGLESKKNPRFSHNTRIKPVLDAEGQKILYQYTDTETGEVYSMGDYFPEASELMELYANNPTPAIKRILTDLDKDFKYNLRDELLGDTPGKQGFSNDVIDTMSGAENAVGKKLPTYLRSPDDPRRLRDTSEVVSYGSKGITIRNEKGYLTFVPFTAKDKVAPTEELQPEQQPPPDPQALLSELGSLETGGGGPSLLEQILADPPDSVLSGGESVASRVAAIDSSVAPSSVAPSDLESGAEFFDTDGDYIGPEASGGENLLGQELDLLSSSEKSFDGPGPETEEEIRRKDILRQRVRQQKLKERQAKTNAEKIVFNLTDEGVPYVPLSSGGQTLPASGSGSPPPPPPRLDQGQEDFLSGIDSGSSSDAEKEKRIRKAAERKRLEEARELKLEKEKAFRKRQEAVVAKYGEGPDAAKKAAKSLEKYGMYVEEQYIDTSSSSDEELLKEKKLQGKKKVVNTKALDEAKAKLVKNQAQKTKKGGKQTKKEAKDEINLTKKIADLEIRRVEDQKKMDETELKIQAAEAAGGFNIEDTYGVATETETDRDESGKLLPKRRDGTRRTRTKKVFLRTGEEVDERIQKKLDRGDTWSYGSSMPFNPEKYKNYFYFQHNEQFQANIDTDPRNPINKKKRIIHNRINEYIRIKAKEAGITDITFDVYSKYVDEARKQIQPQDLAILDTPTQRKNQKPGPVLTEVQQLRIDKDRQRREQKKNKKQQLYFEKEQELVEGPDKFAQGAVLNKASTYSGAKARKARYTPQTAPQYAGRKGDRIFKNITDIGGPNNEERLIAMGIYQQERKSGIRERKYQLLLKQGLTDADATAASQDLTDGDYDAFDVSSEEEIRIQGKIDAETKQYRQRIAAEKKALRGVGKKKTLNQLLAEKEKEFKQDYGGMYNIDKARYSQERAKFNLKQEKRRQRGLAKQIEFGLQIEGELSEVSSAESSESSESEKEKKEEEVVVKPKVKPKTQAALSKAYVSKQEKARISAERELNKKITKANADFKKITQQYVKDAETLEDSGDETNLNSKYEKDYDRIANRFQDNPNIAGPLPYDEDSVFTVNPGVELELDTTDLDTTREPGEGLELGLELNAAVGDAVGADVIIEE